MNLTRREVLAAALGLPALMSACCRPPQIEIGKLPNGWRLCGSGLGQHGTPEHPESLLIYDECANEMFWLDTGTLKVTARYPHWDRSR